MHETIKQVGMDALQETATDGSRRWSSTKLANAAWLLGVLIPSIWYCLLHDKAIPTDCLATITGLLFFGVQTNKAANAWAAKQGGAGNGTGQG